MGLLRLLLALSVVAAHCGGILNCNLVGPQVAVQSFYIISGFYMSMIINEKYIGQNNSYKLFITNRALRLFPIYWVVLLLTIVICLLVGFVSHDHIIPKFDSYLAVKSNFFSFLYLVLTNIFIFGQDVVMFLGIIPESGNLFFTSDFSLTKPALNSFLFIPQAWTLGLELTFYLIAPFILKRGMRVVVLLILISLFIRLLIYYHFKLQFDPWTYRFFPSEIMFFLFGYISYQINLKVKKMRIPKTINWTVLIFVLILTFIYQYLPEIKATYIPFELKEILYFSIITLTIPFLFNFLKNDKLDIQIGELSYPVYISHMLVFTISNGLSIAFIKQGWVIAIATIIFSLLLNRFISLPMEKYRQSRIVKQ